MQIGSNRTPVRRAPTAAILSAALAECLVLPYRMGNRHLIEQLRQVITAGIHTRFVGIDSVAEQSAELRARYNLTLTDSFQIAAAIASGCDSFLTNDSALKRVRELEIIVLSESESQSDTNNQAHATH